MTTTFSESWYQVSPLRLALLPSVRVHKQVYRGEEWYVLQDSASEKYFRLQPVAYRFACELSPRETVAEVWRRFVERYPEEAPGQEEVIQLLSQLHHANLLFFRSDADNDAIFERYRKQRTRENLGKLMALLYLRVPLWDPNDFLNHWRRVLSPLAGPVAFSVWLALILLATKAVIENWDVVWQQGQGILSLSNLPWLYVSIFVLKIFHEMGHAVVCKKYGGQVHTMGIMFIVFAPLPYIDASSSWSMRSRWHRAFVGASGMYVELFFAAIAALVWVNSGSGFVNSMAFNLMVAGSVSALLFNGNPLLRFDAYYMLADSIDMPNLYQRANQQWLYYVDRWLLGTRRAESPSRTAAECTWLTVYGALSLVYRLFIMVIITLMVADIWLGLGLLMVIMMLVIWLIIPLSKLLRYLLTSQRLLQNRLRACLASSLCLLAVLLLVSLVPVSHSIKSPGVVEAQQRLPLFSSSGGVLVEQHVSSGDTVEKGMLLLRIVDEELTLNYAITRYQLDEAQWRYRQALDFGSVDPAPFLEQIEALEERQRTLRQRLLDLDVRAPVTGVWHGSDLAPRLGTTIARGEMLGQIMDTAGYRFVAVVNQIHSSVLFAEPLYRAEIRLHGQPAKTLVSDNLQLIPFQRNVLPSPALSMGGGGSILTRDDGTGRQVTDEGFFELFVVLPEDSKVVLQPGMLGHLRIPLAPRPLAWQLRQRVLQLLQRRYLI